MQNISKIFKIKIRNAVIFVAIDSSYTVNGLYNKDAYDVLNGNHYHAWQELFFVENEPIVLRYNNKEHCFSDCLLFVPPFIEHCTIRKSDYRITFSYKFTGKKNDMSFLDDWFSAKEPFAIACTPGIMSYAKEIEKHFFGAEEYSDEITESFLKLIFCNLALMLSKNRNKQNIRIDESYLDKIENILFEFQFDINLGTVAKKLGLSTRQVSRILKKNYNSTFSDMLCERRLSVACSLLANTDMTIAEIVEYVNFPSESYFYSRFKKIYGMTPRNYRKSKDIYIKDSTGNG